MLHTLPIGVASDWSPTLEASDRGDPERVALRMQL